MQIKGRGNKIIEMMEDSWERALECCSGLLLWRWIIKLHLCSTVAGIFFTCLNTTVCFACVVLDGSDTLFTLQITDISSCSFLVVMLSLRLGTK